MKKKANTALGEPSAPIRVCLVAGAPLALAVRELVARARTWPREPEPETTVVGLQQEVSQ